MNTEITDRSLTCKSFQIFEKYFPIGISFSMNGQSYHLNNDIPQRKEITMTKKKKLL